MNSPDFETPFAFYDLSGEGVGFPNLILRTGRLILDTTASGLATEQMQVIRYSWSNEPVGDGTFDYKVEVLGFHPYEYETSIAGGKALIDAPPYDLFPQWVIGRPWPVVTFVDVEDVNYRTSEGIYEWAPGDLDTDFLLGHIDQVETDVFTDIRNGLRGEYRLKSIHPSELYLSPVDNRLHLKWAEQGLWRLDERQIIRVANLDGDEFIDAWSREVMSELFDESGAAREEIMTDDDAVVKSVPIETLYALDGYLIHSSSGSLTLAASEHQSSLFETLPPTDQATWEAHRALLAPYEIQRRDPANLRGWLNAFPGPRGAISDAMIDNLRATDGGFRFELSLAPGFAVSGLDLLGVGGLAPGDYLVERRGGAFFVSPLVPAALAVDVRQPDPAGPVWLAVGNDGATDVLGLSLIVETELEDGSRFELAAVPVDALAGETTTTLFTIPSNLPAGRPILARLESEDGQTVAAGAPLTVAPRPATGGQTVFTLDRVPVLAPVVALFGIALVLAAVLSLTRRPEDAS
jgi:hypothetical protein